MVGIFDPRIFDPRTYDTVHDVLTAANLVAPTPIFGNVFTDLVSHLEPDNLTAPPAFSSSTLITQTHVVSAISLITPAPPLPTPDGSGIVVVSSVDLITAEPFTSPVSILHRPSPHTIRKRTSDLRPMTDVRIISKANLQHTIADWDLLDDGTLDETQVLANLVKVALMTDRLADVTEQLPDLDSTDRRGWWGDHEAEEIWDGWQIGVKNWLLTRAKITPRAAREGATLIRAEQYAREALQPLITKQYASYIDVWVARSELQRINVLVRIYRGPLEAIDLQFQNLWEEITGISGG